MVNPLPGRAAPMRLAVPDLISPSYFPLIAAVELGCIAARGVECELELRFPVLDAVQDLRAGKLDVLGGAAHTMFHGAPDGGGVRLFAALARHTYWFLVVRSDLGLRPGDPIEALCGLRIAAAPGPVDALVQLLEESGLPPGAVAIGPVPASTDGNTSFGVMAAEALAAGRIDGFWANGMGAEVAVRAGTGTVLIDARRGDGPAGLARFTFPGLMALEPANEAGSARLAAVLAGMMDAQARLREDPGLATEVGRRLFPAAEADLIAGLIARDAPFYEPAIGADDVVALVDFARRRGLTDLDLGADEVIAAGARDLWAAA
ncbi:hypothetical protein GCM10023322_28720 [Rugosimonospora acidiphila]|uniref:ABC transporter substrate-binding protein n=1 Tax=Rugosimonospora acidiphila TaxID=556531 RepID=A0ABP9RS99_9ACTN